MTLSLVQKATPGSAPSGRSATATFGSTPAQNNLIIVATYYNDQLLLAHDPSGYTRAVGREHNSQLWCGVITYKIAGASESTTITPDMNTSSNTGVYVCAYEYSGNATTSTLDVTASNQTAGATSVTSFATGTTSATSQADELAFVLCATNNAITSPSWTNAGAILDGVHSNELITGAANLVSAAAASDTASWTSSTPAVAMIATFKATVTGGAVDTYWLVA